MQLSKNLKVESDAMNIILSKRTVTKKTGKEYWQQIGFYSNVANLLKDLVNMKVRQSGMKDLETTLKAIEKTYKMLDRKVTTAGLRNATSHFQAFK